MDQRYDVPPIDSIRNELIVCRFDGCASSLALQLGPVVVYILDASEGEEWRINGNPTLWTWRLGVASD